MGAKFFKSPLRKRGVIFSAYNRDLGSLGYKEVQPLLTRSQS
jgi:hypothetical protein